MKILTSILNDFKKRISTFPRLDKSLQDSESFITIQITDFDEEFKKAKLLNTEIIAVGDDTIQEFMLYKQMKIFDAIQNIYFKHSTTLHELLKTITKPDHNNATFLDNSNSHNSAFRINFNPHSVSQNPFFEMNVPYVNGLVPKFDGSYNKWIEFMDSYICNVHENEDLSDGSKVKILNGLLEGEAKKVVNREFGVLKTSDYNQIWTKLVRRYNHKKTIVYSYFKDLCFQPSMEKETVDNLKQIYDTTYDSVSALRSMGLNVDGWGDLLLFLTYSKLPMKTKEIWNEHHVKSDTLPDYKNFLDFLENRFRTLEIIEASRKNEISSNTKTFHKKITTLQTNSQNNSSQNKTNNKSSCKLCNKGSHAIRKCFTFKKLNVQERIDTINSFNYCSNCLSFSHTISDCISEGRCEHCKQKHNSTLCISFHKNKAQNINKQRVDKEKSDTKLQVPSVQLESSDLNTFSTMTSVSDETESIIFPTALVKVVSNYKSKSLVLRAMIDGCSDASYITEKAVKRLRLSIERTQVQTAGLGNFPTASCIGMVRFTIGSVTNSSFVKNISAYVISLISPNRPVRSFHFDQSLYKGIDLADPTFNQNASIDLLLGASADASIHKSGSFKCKNENVVFRETELGWVVSGSVPEINCFSIQSKQNSIASFENLNVIFKSLDETLKKFWETEDFSDKRNLTEEEIICEDNYERSTKRLPSGRYLVRLPFKQNSNFINMRNVALNRFSHLERKFSKDLKLKHEYSECLEEYIKLNHMTEVNPNDFKNCYYIPHHCVLKESSSTTKLRVVFDASAKDSSSNSLNDSLLNGPRLQNDLLDHLIRFRTYKIAFTADIAKMYRQIIVHPDDRKFQLILWRLHPVDEIRTYSLNTVTFGTKSAPYLAIKTLIRVAFDEQERFPKGFKCITEGFYVDDCIYGADSVQEAIEIQSEVIGILKSGGFHLRKWSSNFKEVLEMVPESDRETKRLLDFDSKLSVKTLGLQWSPSEDFFCYNFQFSNSETFTKRNIISDIAKIFDPLGWISPCVITAKILIQSLWAERIDWDDPISQEQILMWSTFRSELQDVIKLIKVPRWLNCSELSNVEIHGFSDASSQAYAIAIYLKTKSENKIHVNILCAKTKVAPLKKISIPRLELMAAVLLARMMAHIKSILRFSIAKYFYWSDSQIALAWIHDSPHKRTIFVANRITEIQSLSPSSEWRYVETKQNPSDLGTRGIKPSELSKLSLWWNGPTFLKDIDFESYEQFQSSKVLLPVEDNIKIKKSSKSQSPNVIQTFLSHNKPSLTEISSNLMKFSFDELNKFSTISKLVRIIAFCLRFKKCNRSSHLFITPNEYERALLVVLRIVQEEAFHEELKLVQSAELTTKNILYSLNPFLNKTDGLLRVSGRLEQATHLNFDFRHPIILPYNHTVTRLIVRHAHISTLHGTEQQTMMLITQRYHIIRGKRLVKWVIKNCIKCFRYRCTIQNQLMGQLPQPRTSPNRPFLHSGVDFAGPFDLKRYKGRCNSTVKSYFALFVCFSTKAVHLEVVTDLSTSAFIAAFRRFIARRGLISDLYSDCGSNFIGAKSVITRKMSDVEHQWHEAMAKELSNYQTRWHFNPPGSPHFGGIWEAGVKSVKHHLKRIIGTTKLAYDEFETVIVQIESCLNSRPLCELRSSTDKIVITPGHFLIQDNLLTLPDDNQVDAKCSHLKRWNMLQKIVQDFWNIWSFEYLNTLRQRKKWKADQNNIRVDDVVVLIDKNLPPNSWLLCKVLEVHPGADGLVRVVTLKTKTTTLKRPITKICPLPIQFE